MSPFSSAKFIICNCLGKGLSHWIRITIHWEKSYCINESKYCCQYNQELNTHSINRQDQFSRFLLRPYCDPYRFKDDKCYFCKKINSYASVWSSKFDCMKYIMTKGSNLCASVVPLTISKAVFLDSRSLEDLWGAHYDGNKCTWEWNRSEIAPEDTFYCLIFINCQASFDNSGMDTTTGIKLR